MDPSKSYSLRAVFHLDGVTYPQVNNLPGKTVRNKVNTLIRRTAASAVPDYDPGTTLIEAWSNFKASLNQAGLLSLRFENYVYPEQAAHGVTRVGSITLDLRTGYFYRFNQLFQAGVDYATPINSFIADKISVGQIELLKPFEGVDSSREYYLTPDNLVIYYQPSVYTAGTDGVLEFTLPYNEIKSIIDPNGPLGRI